MSGKEFVDAFENMLKKSSLYKDGIVSKEVRLCVAMVRKVGGVK